MADILRDLENTASEILKESLEKIIPDQVRSIKSSGNLTNVKNLKDTKTKPLGYSTLKQNILPY